MDGHSDKRQVLIGLVYEAAMKPEKWLELMEFIERSGMDVRELSTWLEPHLERSSELARTLDAHAHQVRVMQSLLDRMPMGVLLMDADGRVQASNQCFERITGQTSLRLKHGRLASANAAESRRIADAVSDLRDGTEAECCLEGGAGDARWRLRLIPADSAFAEALHPSIRIVGLVTTPSLTVRLDRDRLREAFGLSHTEALLLESLATRCHSIKELAVRLDRNEATVRRQIANIYEKTDTHSQLELVKLALRYASHEQDSAHPDEASDARINQRLTLPDGRTLSFAEYGAANGRPVILAHGLAASRLLLPPDLSALEKLRVRLLIPERPGYGHSSPTDPSCAADWADDLRALLDVLGIQRCAMLGHILGNVYAMAAAALLPDRIATLTIVSGYGPDFAAHGLPLHDRLTLKLARHSPQALETLMHAVWRLTRDAPMEGFRFRLRRLSDPEREIMDDPAYHPLYERSYREATRQGIHGLMNDLCHVVRDWGFAPEDIRCPVHIWHGRQDTQIPCACAESLARRIPNSRLTIDDHSGRMLMLRRWEDILASLG